MCTLSMRGLTWKSESDVYWRQILILTSKVDLPAERSEQGGRIDGDRICLHFKLVYTFIRTSK